MKTLMKKGTRCPLLLLFLLVPALTQAQWSNGFKGDSTAVTSSWTQLTLATGRPITGGSFQNAGSGGQVIYIGFSLNSATAAPDTASGHRVYMQAGDSYGLERGFSGYIVWVRSKSGTVPLKYEIH